jgi:predicted permease
MNLLSRIRSWAQSLLRRSRFETEMDAELHAHIASYAEDLVRGGTPPREALRRARLEFGGLDRVKEECRESRGLAFLDALLQDLRFALRMLRKSPGFTAVAVLTLALGIGANTAIFSVIDAVLLRSLPYPDANRLVELNEFRPESIGATGVSFPDYLVWSRENKVFDETAAYFQVNASNDIVLGGPFSAERARYSIVTTSFFTLLGVQPALGRSFSPDDATPRGPNVFLISDALWRSLFGGDPRALGKTYLLDGENSTLIGVMPRGFDFPAGCNIWIPTGALGESGFHDRISHAFRVLGRLRPGVSLFQAEAGIQSLQQSLAIAYPDTDSGWRVHAQPLLTAVVGNIRSSLFLLLGAVGFVLLIACANLINLLLARASTREREFVVRAALGAGRGRLLRQNMTEGFLLVFLSALLALFFAKWGLALAISLASIQLPRMDSFHLDFSVLAFLSVIAAAVTLLVGLASSLQSSRHDPQGALRDRPHGGGPGLRGRRLRGALVVSEVSLALLLVCGAGLMLRSFVQLIRVNPGFQPQHLLTMKIALPSGLYPRSQQTSIFLDRLLAQLRAVPGVQSVAAASTLPLSGESDWGTFLIAGRSAPDWSHASATAWRGVSVDYFRTLGIPLLRGRDFTPLDAKNQNAAIINQAMADYFWPGQDPLGQKILNRDQRDPIEIIGVVADTKGSGLDSAPKPEMYTLLRGFWYAFLAVRTSQDPSAAAASVRAQISALDKGVPVYQMGTMDQLLGRSLSSQRFNLLLLGLFAAIALGLAVIGIYGVLSFSVSRRTHEIGIRMALGAHPRQILRWIVWQGMRLVALGVLLGISASLVLTRLMASLLYATSPIDPLTFAGVSLLLLFVALAACYIPARRALRVDPVSALRCE